MEEKQKGSLYRKLASGVLAVGLLVSLAGAFAYASEFGLLSDNVSTDVYSSAVSATTGSDGSASGTVTPTVVTTSSGTTDYYGYVTYTPAETGYYSVASTSSTDDVCIRVREKDTGDIVAAGNGYGAQATGLLTGGTTYYLAFAFYDSDNDEFESASGSIGYTVSKLVATDITLDTTYTNKVSTAGTYALYTLTVTEEAQYRLIASGNSHTAYVYLYDSSWKLKRSGTSISRTLEAGTYYIATSLYSSTATGRYTFTAHQCANLSGATVATTQSSYAFTGSYLYPDVTVTLNGSTVDENDYYIDGYSNNKSIGTGTVYVCDYYGNELSATFTITTPDAETATAGSSYSVTLGAGESAYYSFTPTASASYTFYTTGSYDTYGYLYDASFSQLTYNDDSGDDTNMSITYSCTAGTTYYIGLRFYSSSTSGTFTFCIDGTADTDSTSDVVGNTSSSLNQNTAASCAVAVTEGTSYSVDLSSGYYAYYSFTPTESANYIFSAAGDADYYLAIYNSSWSRLERSWGDYDTTTITCSLSAGTTYYAVIYTEDAATFTFSVKQPADLTGATLALSQTSYSFTGSEVYPDITVTLADGTVVSSDEYSISYSNNLWPGTGKVTVTDTNGTKLKQTFTITEPTATITTSGKVVTVAGGETVAYAFTPSSDGEYQFTLTPSLSLDEYAVFVYDPLEEDSEEGWSSCANTAMASYDCYAGDTYYVVACNYDSLDATFTLGIASELADVTDATVSVAQSSYAFTGDYIIPSVTVKLASGKTAATGSYAVSCSGNRYPGTATVTVTGADGSTASAEFTITSPKLTDATAIAPEQLYTGRISTAGSYKLYSITPSQDSYYEFSVSGKQSVRAMLFDADGTLLDGSSSYVEYSLETGKTYYIAVCLYSASATGKFVMYTYGPSDLTYAEVSVANAAYTGKALEPAVTVTLDGGTLTEGDDYTVTYSDNKKIGTGTVTVKGTGSFSGSQTATFTISKGVNTLTVKAKSATVKGKTKGGKLKKNVTLKASKLLKVSKAKGRVTYKRGAVKLGSKKVKGAQLKKIAINGKTGKVTLKKGLKKGTYTVKVKVKAAGNGNYKAKTKTVAVTIKVK